MSNITEHIPPAPTTLELFSIGVGPSSSHTVGPMRAAAAFRAELARLLDETRLGKGGTDAPRIRCELYGSLAATGRGHGTDTAVIAGLHGESPETTTRERIADAVARSQAADDVELRFVLDRLARHTNGLRFTALDADGEPLLERVYFSVGGGFVVDEDGEALGAALGAADATPKAAQAADPAAASPAAQPHPFSTAAELLERCRATGLSIAELTSANDAAVVGAAALSGGIAAIWSAMRGCVQAGITAEDEFLPGGLLVRRRAPRLHERLAALAETERPADAGEWVGLWALAVNEENASGGRVVTAPTNGAAGIIPAVLHYYRRFVAGADDEGVARFLLTAAAIGVVIKAGASISGAEVGCQGEVGSAASMAAAGLCAVLGGTPAQVENAAEIGLEHHLGLTCDPVGGLVQIPCIERNAVAANTAIVAARLALQGDGEHRVSLDMAIRTMAQTGRDMKSIYKETSQGGLAVNVIEC